jgi:hypothetical protein
VRTRIGVRGRQRPAEAEHDQETDGYDGVAQMGDGSEILSHLAATSWFRERAFSVSDLFLCQDD